MYFSSIRFGSDNTMKELFNWKINRLDIFADIPYCLSLNIGGMWLRTNALIVACFRLTISLSNDQRYAVYNTWLTPRTMNHLAFYYIHLCARRSHFVSWAKANLVMISHNENQPANESRRGGRGTRRQMLASFMIMHTYSVPTLRSHTEVVVRVTQRDSHFVDANTRWKRERAVLSRTRFSSAFSIHPRPEAGLSVGGWSWWLSCDWKWNFLYPFRFSHPHGVYITPAKCNATKPRYTVVNHCRVWMVGIFSFMTSRAGAENYVALFFFNR